MKFQKKYILGVTLVAITILAALIRLQVINTYPVDRDEFARILPEFTFKSLVPPGFIFLTKLSALIFNYSDFGFRLPIFLMGVIGIPLIYWLGKTIFGKYEGLLAAFTLTLLHTHISYSNQTKEYVPMMTFATLSSIFFFKILTLINIKSKLNWKLIIYYLLSSLGGVFFSGYFFILFVFYQLIVLFLRVIYINYKAKSFKKIVNRFPFKIILGLGLIIIPLLLMFLINRADAYFGIRITMPQSSFVIRYWQEIGYFVTADNPLSYMTNALFIAGIVIFPFLPRIRLGIFYIVTMILLDLILVSTVRFSHSAFMIYYIRYHSFLLPIYLVMVTGSLVGIITLVNKKGWRIISIVMVFAYIFYTFSRCYPIIRWYFVLPSSIAFNFKDAGAYLNSHIQPGDVLVRLKNFGVEHKFNHVNHYISQEVLKKVDYEIFPDRNASTNWYVPMLTGEEDEMGFPGYLCIERIKPSLRYNNPVICKLKYFGPFIRTRKLNNENLWNIKTSSGQSSVGLMIDHKIATSWESAYDEKQLVIDLKKVYLLNSIRFAFNQLYPQKVRIKLSENGIDQKEIYNFDSLLTGTPNSQIFFPPTNARYITVELKGSGINEVSVWEVYEEEIPGFNKQEVVPSDLPGIQIKDGESPNGLVQVIPYKKEDEYAFFQIGEKLNLKKGKYRINFKIKVDKIVSNWKENLLPPLSYRLYEYLEPKGVSPSDILYLSVETTRATFFDSPVRFNLHGEDFKEANKYYDYFLIFETNGKETLSIQAFNSRDRRYPANLYITYPQIEEVR